MSGPWATMWRNYPNGPIRELRVHSLTDLKLMLPPLPKPNPAFESMRSNLFNVPIYEYESLPPGTVQGFDRKGDLVWTYTKENK